MEYFIDLGGKKRKGVRTNCLHCNESIISRIDQPKKFCNKQCSSNHKKKRTTLNCPICNNEFERKVSRMKKSVSKSGLYFCSSKCKDKAQEVDTGLIPLAHYNGGKYSYRKRALKEYDSKCTQCGYDEHEQGLEVHHIDKDRNNNELSNLIVLCGTCHLLVHHGVLQL